MCNAAVPLVRSRFFEWLAPRPGRRPENRLQRACSFAWLPEGVIARCLTTSRTVSRQSILSVVPVLSPYRKWRDASSRKAPSAVDAETVIAEERLTIARPHAIPGEAPG